MLNNFKNMLLGGNTSEDQKGDSIVITVDKDTKNATKAWQRISLKQTFNKVEPMDTNTPVSEDKLRFVCISDTHSAIEKNPLEFVPAGDILLHAGDITQVGQPKEIKKFNEYLAKLPHKHKVVIAGNHDLTFDPSVTDSLSKWRVNPEKVKEFLYENGVEEVKDLLTNCVYLEDAMVTLYGVNIYGSPWQPWFYDWGFNLSRGEEILQKWDLIPEKTDILITHGPPVGHGDMTRDGVRAGCVELLNTIQKRIKPKYHIFGHIHEGYGMTTDGYTHYINASTCTLKYIPKNPPIVFDFPIPEGHSKQEVVDLTVTHFGSQGQRSEDKEKDDGIEFKEDEESNESTEKSKY